jgi:protein TIF31
MRKLAEEFSGRMKEITVASLGLEVNPNCFLDYEFDVDAAVREKDEATARELAAFLWDTVLPAVTKQVRDGDIQIRDNVSMVKVLHRHGVNMRYLGALLTQATAEEKEDEDLLAQGKQKVHAMPLYWREMLTIEVLARASKYVLNGYFKSAAVYAAPAQTVASLLNHILSLFVPAVAPAATTETVAASANDAKKGGKKRKGGKTETATPAPAATVLAAAKVDNAIFPAVDGTASKEECLRSLQATAVSRFCHNLHLVQGDGSTDVDVAATAQFMQSRLSAATLIRRICQATGIQIATRKYNFSAANPFAAADILGLTPIARTCEPESLLQEFEDMIESSRGYLQESNHAYAYEMAHQALNTITQVMSAAFSPLNYNTQPPVM